MARCNQLSALVLILCLSLGHTAYSPWARWILTNKWLDSGKIKDSLGTAPDIVRSDSSPITSSSCTCSSYQAKSTETYNIVADFTSAVSASPSEFGISIWVYFDSTLNSKPFSFDFGPSENPPYYKGSSSSDNGKITFTFADSLSTIDNSIDFDVTVDTGKWLFFAFYWAKPASDVTWSIFTPSLATVEKTSSSSSTAYVMPGGYLSFGSSVAGYYYEIQVFKTVSRASTTDLAITLADANGVSYAATTSTCSNSCSTYCYPDYGCLSTTACQCPLNCADCSINTVCTQCNPDYYLHDTSYGTECISCTASCNSCEPDAACYECALSVIKVEGMCRVDSVGFQVSFSYPYLVLDFAHPLNKPLTVGNLVAKTADGTAVRTSDWTIDASSTLSKLKVKTSLTQSQLPISLDLKFGRA
ncbi:unnamed protein product [Blepharisma stoltei]|uniref:Uncharacterized protein n=1 Tax=Blepharisma stoltei TaxID=1481888 RepID=A0AAU9ITX5_9CILI|nr:unnamed protein product [Blepharisma stoltei]